MLSRKKIKDGNLIFLYLVIISWSIVLYKFLDLDFLYKKNIQVTFSEDDSLIIEDVFQNRQTKYLHTLYIDEINFPLNDKKLQHDHLSSISRLNLKHNFFGDFHIRMDVIHEGLYEFTIKTDDGFVLFLDSKELMKFEKRRELKKDTFIVFLKKGNHFMDLIYFQAMGKTCLQFKYRPLKKDGQGYFVGQDTRYIVF